MGKPPKKRFNLVLSSANLASGIMYNGTYNVDLTRTGLSPEDLNKPYLCRFAMVSQYNSTFVSTSQPYYLCLQYDPNNSIVNLNGGIGTNCHGVIPITTDTSTLRGINVALTDNPPVLISTLYNFNKITVQLYDSSGAIFNQANNSTLNANSAYAISLEFTEA